MTSTLGEEILIKDVFGLAESLLVFSCLLIYFS